MRAGVPKGGRRVALCDVIVRPSVQFVTTLAWISYFVTFLFFCWRLLRHKFNADARQRKTGFRFFPTCTRNEKKIQQQTRR